MFAFLRGVVAAKTLEHIHLDVNGVGYELRVPDSVHRRLTPDQTVTLLTYCHIREDAFQIFGFLREEEKSLFLMLLSINGVGPKVALSFLSTLTPAEFGQAILASDVSAITKVPVSAKRPPSASCSNSKQKWVKTPNSALSSVRMPTSMISAATTCRPPSYPWVALRRKPKDPPQKPEKKSAKKPLTKSS